MPEEPSVLDYLKSRLKFWDRKGWIEIPPEPESPKETQTPEPVAKRTARAAVKKPAALALEPEPAPAEVAPVEVPAPRGFPWRSLLALLLALFGQAMWEPQARNLELGVALYLSAIGLAVWAFLKKEWLLASLPADESRPEPMTVRLWPLIVGVFLSAAAFWDLHDNLFTWHNVLLWLAAIGFFAYAFWLRRPGQTPQPAKDKVAQRKQWLWVGLVLAVVALVVFFRVYQLNQVPSEPISDHAEKILDVYDVSQGQTQIFFPRNTGREAIQMYLTLLVSWIFSTGLSFLSLKIGTVLCGLLTLPYMYLLGKEFGGRRVGLLALLFAGIAYWPNVISRFGLRFPLYALFAAPTLYYLLRGLRTRNRNDFIISGIFLGFGLHGYTPFRIVPFVVVIAVGLYLVHAQSKGNRKQAVVWLVMLALVSLIVFLPLARYWIENPQGFSYRAFSRVGTVEAPLPAPAWKIFSSNTWNALRMFNWEDGEIWVISVMHRPALDVVSGALFILGIVLLLARYIQKRNWRDLFLLLAIPLLQLPSILSLAYPGENPALNRASGAMVPVFLIVAIALDGLLAGIRSRMTRRTGIVLVWVAALLLAGISSAQNYNLVFNQYATEFTQGAWNSSEMGQQIVDFRDRYGTTDTVWVVCFPNRVDTRLPGVWAGVPNRDFGIWPDQMAGTVSTYGPKLFILWSDDTVALETLQQLYPQGVLTAHQSKSNVPGHDFLTYLIPSN